MAAIDPYRQLTGRGLRHVVIACLDDGRILIPLAGGGRSHAEDRMDERHVTAPEIEAVLRSGVHSTESCVAGKWRYRARKNIIEVIFPFDVDDDGNLLVVVTVMRKEHKS